MSSINEHPIGEVAQIHTFPLFSLFPLLSTEIRLKIWALAMVPRQIVLENHASLPPLNPRPSVALLLVNREAYDVFRKHNTRCLNGPIDRGIYINFSLDTLCLASGLSGLEYLMIAHHSTLMGLKWLDIAPGTIASPHWDTAHLQSLKSLELIVVRSLGFRPKFIESVGDDTDIANIVPCTVPYSMAEHRYDYNVAYTLNNLAEALGMDSEVYQGPKLVAFFAPEECKITRVRPDLMRLRWIWDDPCESTWEKLEGALPCSSAWPGRMAAKTEHWFIQEVKGLKHEF